MPLNGVPSRRAVSLPVMLSTDPDLIARVSSESTVSGRTTFEMSVSSKPDLELALERLALDAEQRHARELQRQPFDQLRQEIRGCPCAGHLVDRANRGVEQRHHPLDFPAQRLALLGVARGLAGPGGCLAELRLGLLAQPCLRLQRVVQAQLQLPHRVFTLGALGFQRVRPRAAHVQLGDDDVVAFDGGDGCREIAFEGAGAAANGVEIGFDGAASAVGGGEVRFERGDARVGGFELGFEQPRVLADDPYLAGERIALDGRLTGGRQLLLQRRTFAAGSFELGGEDVALVGDGVAPPPRCRSSSARSA